MSKSSFKPGKVERFYSVMTYVFAMAIGYTTVGAWAAEKVVEGYQDPGVPGAVIFLLVFGWLVMEILESAERSYRKSVKWYEHGGRSVLAKW